MLPEGHVTPEVVVGGVVETVLVNGVDDAVFISRDIGISNLLVVVPSVVDVITKGVVVISVDVAERMFISHGLQENLTNMSRSDFLIIY